MRFKSVMFVALAALTAFNAVPSSTFHAQSQTPDNTIILSLAVPPGPFRNVINDNNILQPFEAANPGIKVNLVDAASIPFATNGLQAHFDALTTYANSADVLYVTQSAVSTAATRAGYFLDLSSLIASDSSFDSSDFYPALWQSYQWDRGTWALPIDSTLLVLGYDPAAFDKAGLNYPTDQWTLADLINAINKLTQKDTNGNVSVPGLAIPAAVTEQMLYRSLVGHSLVDASVDPNAPQIDQPEAEAVLTAFAQQYQLHQIGGPADLVTSPLVIAPAADLLGISTISRFPSVRKVAPLPGGRTGVQVDGFAISKGTQYPEQAFALLKYLTTRPELAVGTAATPARKSLVRAANLPAAQQSQFDQGMQSALSIADMRYTEYLKAALTQMMAQNVDAQTALQSQQNQAIADMQTADAQKSKVALNVVPPAGTAPLAPGKVAITFNVNSVALPLPNQALWDKVVADFSAADPQVGGVILTTNRMDINKSVAQFDCFYQPSNVINNTDLSQLLSVDSFLDADKNFDRADIVGSVLADVQTGNKTWAIPIDLSPVVMQYNSVAFKTAGVPAPTNGWTIDAFVNALKALKPDSATPPPFVAGSDGIYMLDLIAAFGGLPLDYRTNPPTVSFTDPNTFAAIQQALDLAKQGYIKYASLGNFLSRALNSDRTATLFVDALNNYVAQQTSSSGPYKLTTLPTSSQYMPFGYTIGTAYISAKASNPDGCYRFIATLAQHPELFPGMPARRSQLGNPALKAVLPSDTLTLYAQLDAAMKDQRAVPILPSATPVSEITRYWLYQAFDQYVLHSADLKTALQNAEPITKGYLGCVANVPPFQIGAGLPAARPFAQCAVKVDPSLATGPLGALAK